MRRMLCIFTTIVIGGSALSALRAQDQAPQPANAAPVFRIDPVHSTALFRVQHMGAGHFYGRFNDVTGTIHLTGDSKTPLRVEVTIAVASVDTGSERLDGHLKSPDFFDVEKHPSLSFKSTGTKKVGDADYEVTGDLTIHGVTKPLTARVKQVGMRDGPRGTQCGFETTFTIQRSEFGMKYGIENGALGDETQIILSVEAGSGGGGPGGRGNIRERLESFDKNGDGKIEKSEVPESMTRIFMRLDANGDGVIDEAEMSRGGGRRGGN